jgi:hypothetical protein
MSTKNLWGKLPQAETIRSPVAILREQASLLGEMTGMLLEGRVHTWRDALLGDRPFRARLCIVAPSLDNYEVEIAEIGYPLGFYPATVASIASKRAEAENEEEFIHVLEGVLSSAGVKQVITRLLTQIQGEEAAG